MLSDRQKSVLFKTRIVSKPRYVRVPLQMCITECANSKPMYISHACSSSTNKILNSCNASCPMNGFATCGPMCTA